MRQNGRQQCTAAVAFSISRQRDAIHVAYLPWRESRRPRPAMHAAGRRCLVLVSTKLTSIQARVYVKSTPCVRPAHPPTDGLVHLRRCLALRAPVLARAQGRRGGPASPRPRRVVVVLLLAFSRLAPSVEVIVAAAAPLGELNPLSSLQPLLVLQVHLEVFGRKKEDRGRQRRQTRRRGRGQRIVSCVPFPSRLNKNNSYCFKSCGFSSCERACDGYQMDPVARSSETSSLT